MPYLIYVQGKKYYYQGTYGNYLLAIKQAKKIKKKYKKQYYIMKQGILYSVFTRKIPK